MNSQDANSNPDRQAALQQFVLNQFPFPVAVNYKRLLDATSWESSVLLGIHVFEILLRSLCLALVSQYVIQDHKQLADEQLDRYLLKKMPQQTLGSLVDILFRILSIYKSQCKTPLFIKELRVLVDKKEAKKAFMEMAEIRNDLFHRFIPIDENGWRNKFEEIHTRLLFVFSLLEFLEYYDFVRVVHRTGKQYSYEKYKGLQVVTTIDQLPSQNDDIHEGWFYLLKNEKGAGKLLHLYPYIIAYEQDADEQSPGLQMDAGLLDTFTRTQVKYLAMALREKISREDDELLAYFNFYFYRPLEGEQIRAHVLSWEFVRNLGKDISQNRMGDALKKYSAELYLERKKVQGVFNDFLKSDKTCLVLTGKSGVGKSNFLVATANSLEKEENICVVLYNGARLPSDKSINELLKEDIQSRIETDKDVWEMLSNTMKVNDRKLLIFIDALNENPKATEILGHLNQVIDSNVHAWLKIVITSRPEAWRTMNHHIDLARHKFYWPSERDEMGMELEEFAKPDPTFVDPFLYDELELVYEKYKKHYHLHTEFKEIPVEIRQELRDPLVLRLVASTCEADNDGYLPPTLRPSEIYRNYIAGLIRSERLHRDDLDLITRWIIPKMAASNKPLLSDEDLSLDPLFREKIVSEDILSNGRPVNSSFQNLVDSELLVGLQENSPVVVGFRYERFYDYFMGDYIYEKNKNEKDKIELYRILISQIEKAPFLWGGVRNAIFLEYISGVHQLLDILAGEQDPSTRELVVAVLTELGREPSGIDDVKRAVCRLLKLGRKKRLPINFLWQKANEKVSLYSRYASKTALEVARRLKMIDVSEDTARDSSPQIRLMAVRNIYHYWRSNRAEGYNLFERLAKNVINPIGLPNVPALESCLGLSMLMMREYYPDNPDGSQVGTQVMDKLRNITRMLFGIKQRQGKATKIQRVFLRNIILKAFIKFIVKTQEAYPEDKPSFMREVRFLVEAEPEAKTRYNKLLDYFDNPTHLQEIMKDLFSAATYNDTLTNGLCWLLLNLEFIRGGETDYSIFEDLANEELDLARVGGVNEGMIIALGLIGAYKQDTSDRLFDQLQRMTYRYIQRTKGFYFSRDGTRHPNLAINPYLTICRLRQNPEDRDLVADFIKNAIEEKDWIFFRMLVESLTEQVSYSGDLVDTQLALRSLRTIFPIPKGTEIEVEPIIVDALARIRLYNQDEADNFLLEIDPNNNLLPRVLRAEPDEQVWGELFHNVYAKVLLRLLHTPEIKNLLVRILRQATCQHSLDKYLEISVKILINALVGEEIFGK